jgi:hypothetical protein
MLVLRQKIVGDAPVHRAFRFEHLVGETGLLSQSELCFSRLDIQSDKREARMSAAQLQSNWQKDQQLGTPAEISAFAAYFSEQINLQGMFGSFWTKNKVLDAAAVSASYGGCAVIVSSYQRLANSFEHNRHIHVGRVCYVEQDHIPPEQEMFRSAFTKSVSLSWEREVRLILPDLPSGGHMQPYFQDRPRIKFIPVNLLKMIKKVLVLPSANRGQRKVLNTTCRRLSIPCEAVSAWRFHVR